MEEANDRAVEVKAEGGKRKLSEPRMFEDLLRIIIRIVVNFYCLI